jgi:hypothetical protein
LKRIKIFSFRGENISEKEKGFNFLVFKNGEKISLKENSFRAFGAMISFFSFEISFDKEIKKAMPFT